jgi:glycosyltransferase involved in cell wall biosynthesis
MPNTETRDIDLSYPRITIGIPTYNRSSLVKRCVENVLAQTYGNIEVLVSDNASTDGTLPNLRSIKDARLRVLVNSENIGAVNNFSRCIREASGDYLLLLSDDNFLADATFLERCAAMIRLEPRLPLVVGTYDILELEGIDDARRRVIPAVTSKKLSTGIWAGTEVFSEYCQGRLSAGPLSVVIRTDVLRANNHYTAEYRCVHDTATWTPALLEGRAGLINERCATYIIHGGAISFTKTVDEWIADYKKVTDELYAAGVRKFPDPETQGLIRKLTLRYLVYQGMITLVLYRRANATLMDVFRKLWSWRPIFAQCSWVDFIAVARLRSLGRILLPQAIIRLSMAVKIDKLF